MGYSLPMEKVKSTTQLQKRVQLLMKQKARLVDRGVKPVTTERGQLTQLDVDADRPLAIVA
jgi:hypothetical protein